ncbi:MAG: hypothetical protein LBF97_08315 [Elusimicrobiota bacterium]|jgi:hypothetical protein|nr:hypothetical protein [Elusimicrobiota bacterium]
MLANYNFLNFIDFKELSYWDLKRLTFDLKENNKFDLIKFRTNFITDKTKNKKRRL